MKKTITFALLSATFGLLQANAAVDCVALSLSITNAVKNEQSKVLEIVSKEAAAAPSCACEIVKSAIEASAADAKMVAAIVEVSAIAAPEQMRLIAQCAVAVAPDALDQVQAVLAKLDPNLGESGKSSKGAKSPAGEVANAANPLDFPGQGPIGPNPGSPGGFPLIPQLPPVIIAPPDVSNVNP
jgi:hypothetical protein